MTRTARLFTAWLVRDAVAAVLVLAYTLTLRAERRRPSERATDRTWRAARRMWAARDAADRAKWIANGWPAPPAGRAFIWQQG